MSRLGHLRQREAELLAELRRSNLPRGMEIGARGQLKRIRSEIESLEAAKDTSQVIQTPNK